MGHRSETSTSWSDFRISDLRFLFAEATSENPETQAAAREVANVALARLAGAYPQDPNFGLAENGDVIWCGDSHAAEAFLGLYADRETCSLVDEHRRDGVWTPLGTATRTGKMQRVPFTDAEAQNCVLSASVNAGLRVRFGGTDFRLSVDSAHDLVAYTHSWLCRIDRERQPPEALIRASNPTASDQPLTIESGDETTWSARIGDGVLVLGSDRAHGSFAPDLARRLMIVLERYLEFEQLF